MVDGTKTLYSHPPFFRGHDMRVLADLWQPSRENQPDRANENVSSRCRKLVSG
jgi:hypothetical protein